MTPGAGSTRKGAPMKRNFRWIMVVLEFGMSITLTWSQSTFRIQIVWIDTTKFINSNWGLRKAGSLWTIISSVQNLDWHSCGRLLVMKTLMIPCSSKSSLVFYHSSCWTWPIDWNKTLASLLILCTSSNSFTVSGRRNGALNGIIIIKKQSNDRISLLRCDGCD